MVVCPKFGFEITDSLKLSYCQSCIDKCYVVQPSYNPLGKVDVFVLGRLLKEQKASRS